MSCIATRAVIERPVRLQGLRLYAALFQELFSANPAPWLYSTLSQLRELERAGTQTRGIGDLRIEPNTATRVKRLLYRIGDSGNFPVPAVNVFSGGGVTLKWQVGPREVKYTFWPEGVLSYWQEDAGRTVADEELADENTFNPRGPVEWLLER